MKRRITIACLVALASWGASASAIDVAPGANLAREADWSVPAADAVKAQLDAWLKDLPLDEARRAAVAAVWPAALESPTGEQLHDLVVRTLELAHEGAAEIVKHCASEADTIRYREFPLLADEKLPSVVRANLNLHYGRFLVQKHIVDDAARHLLPLSAADVADPAALLFYQGVVHHKQLSRDAGLESLGRLLEGPEDLPKRYRSLALLMQADLESLQDDSLDHISRRMDDIRRRLHLGHAGPKVRAVEDGVIASLDKLIKEKEEEAARRAAQQSGGSGSQGNNIRSVSPARDSMPLGGKAEGTVDKKNIGNKSGWGNLPPKQRDEAMQQIGKEFPSHYREVVEQYFRKVASESDAQR